MKLLWIVVVLFCWAQADEEAHAPNSRVARHASASIYNEAFSAKMSIRRDLSLSSGDTIPFTEVEYQTLSSSYSTSNSKYTCPTHGLYFFSFHLTVKRLTVNNAEVMIMKNTAQKASFLHKEASHENLGGSAMFECNAGDTVWIQANGRLGLWGPNGYGHNTFSGFKIMSL